MRTLVASILDALPAAQAFARALTTPLKRESSVILWISPITDVWLRD